MGETLARSGASVTVTSLTDVLCFAVGLFSNLPVVRLFCLYTSLALTVDFIYQVNLNACSLYANNNMPWGRGGGDNEALGRAYVLLLLKAWRHLRHFIGFFKIKLIHAVFKKKSIFFSVFSLTWGPDISAVYDYAPQLLHYISFLTFQAYVEHSKCTASILNPFVHITHFRENQFQLYGVHSVQKNLLRPKISAFSFYEGFNIHKN